MLRKILALVFALCFVVNCTAQPQWDGLKQRQHKAMHWIIMQNATDEAGCTANAIGRHALITAAHCDLPGATIRLDGSPIALNIVEKDYDGHDHMILIVPIADFKDRIDYEVTAPGQGDHVYFWGNPNAIRDQYREGVYTGQVVLDNDDVVKDGTDVDLFMTSTQPGDSGSAIFNAEGKMVGIVTYGIFKGMFAGSYALNFSKAQIDRARTK